MPATHFTSISHITALHILHFYTQSKRLLLTIVHCSLYTVSRSSLGGLHPKWPPGALVLRHLQLPHAFYTSMYLEVIAVLHCNNHDGNIHTCGLKVCISSKYSKCISAIKRILYTTAMYISSSSFMYLCISLYCDACLKSSALRVGVKTSHNTIWNVFMWFSKLYLWFVQLQTWYCFCVNVFLKLLKINALEKADNQLRSGETSQIMSLFQSVEISCNEIKILIKHETFNVNHQRKLSNTSKLMSYGSRFFLFKRYL